MVKQIKIREIKVLLHYRKYNKTSQTFLFPQIFVNLYTLLIEQIRLDLKTSWSFFGKERRLIWSFQNDEKINALKSLGQYLYFIQNTRLSLKSILNF